MDRSLDRHDDARLSERVRLSEAYSLRSVRFLELLAFDEWYIKLYGIAYRAERPDPALVDAAVAVARDRLPHPAVTGDRYGVGFLGVHEGRGGGFVFLDWWATENDLHHHTWRSGAERLDQVRPTGPSELTACSSDVSVIAHERDAWVEHVLARPDGPDLAAYLDDRLDADV